MEKSLKKIPECSFSTMSYISNSVVNERILLYVSSSVQMFHITNLHIYYQNSNYKL